MLPPHRPRCPDTGDTAPGLLLLSSRGTVPPSVPHHPQQCQGRGWGARPHGAGTRRGRRQEAPCLPPTHLRCEQPARFGPRGVPLRDRRGVRVQPGPGTPVQPPHPHREGLGITGPRQGSAEQLGQDPGQWGWRGRLLPARTSGQLRAASTASTLPGLDGSLRSLSTWANPGCMGRDRDQRHLGGTTAPPASTPSSLHGRARTCAEVSVSSSLRRCSTRCMSSCRARTVPATWASTSSSSPWLPWASSGALSASCTAPASCGSAGCKDGRCSDRRQPGARTWRRGDATRPGRPSSPRTRGRALLLTDLSGCLRPAPGCPHGSAQPWHVQSWELPARPSSPRPSPPAALGTGTGTVSPGAAVAVLGNLCPTDTAPARAHAGHLGSPSAAAKARRVPGLLGCHSAPGLSRAPKPASPQPVRHPNNPHCKWGTGKCLPWHWLLLGPCAARPGAPGTAQAGFIGLVTS